jgi:photosystem II stability/assembly factor-like uncharacterized protein
VSALPPGAGNEVYVVGDHQTVLKSADNGTTWTKLPAPLLSVTGAPLDFTYRTVQATSLGHAFIAGDDGHRLQTSDGGQDWDETDGQSGASYRTVRLASNTDGMSVSNAPAGPRVDFTTTAWKYTQPAFLPASPPLYGGDFIGNDAIVVGAAGTVLRAADGFGPNGAHFAPESADVRAVASPVAGVYVAAGGGSLILRSKDDGASWTPATLTSNPFGSNIEFRALGFDAPDSKGNSVGYLAGGVPGQPTPVIFRSLDSGVTWSPVNIGAGADGAAVTGLAVFSGNVVACAENGTVYTFEGGKWGVERPLPNFPGPWLAVSAGDNRRYIVGARGNAARYPAGDGSLAWQALNTGTINDMAAISGPPNGTTGFGSLAGGAVSLSAGSGQSLRDDIRGVSMRPEGILLTDTGGLALFGDLNQDTYIELKDGVASVQSVSGQSAPDDDAYFFGDIFPPVPSADILPGDGVLDMRDTTRVIRKTQGLD